MKHLSPQVPLGRLAYVGWGVGLALLKFVLDYVIALAFHRPYTPLFYLDPSSAPLLHPGEAQGYWATLAGVMVPFATIGVILTVRRLRDAGMSPWLALFFFVPFANLLFFLATALVPPYRAAVDTVVPAASPFRSQPIRLAAFPKERSLATAILYSSALGSVVALGGFAISVGLLGKYGFGLAFGTPMISGFVGGAFVPRFYPKAKFRHALLVMVFTFVLSLSLIIVTALEGLGCLVLFLPILVLPTMLGTWIGFVAGQQLPRTEHAITAAGGSALLCFLFATEALNPNAMRPAPVVETIVDIDAPPEAVWALTTSVAEMPIATNFPFSAGIAYPIRATLDRAGVRGKRTCEFNTGAALETVVVWDENRRLRFSIDSQPDPLRELTLYTTVRQPHLDSSVRNRLGEFELVPLDGGTRTRLIGRSWYELSVTPAFYWEAYTAQIVHAIHHRVLGTIKSRAEAKVRLEAQR